MSVGGITVNLNLKRMVISERRAALPVNVKRHVRNFQDAILYLIFVELRRSHEGKD